MNALVLDAGAFVATERADRAVAARLRVAAASGFELRTPGVVVAQVWRDPGGRQAVLARLLSAVDVVPVDERFGRRAGVLLGRTGMTDAVDATVVAVAKPGDRVLTSDADDIHRMVVAAGRNIRVVAC